MNKLLFSIMLLTVALTTSAQGSETQDETPAQKYNVTTNSFWSNWFVEAGVDWNNHYSTGLPTKSSAGIGLAVGKWFIPSIGLRTKIQGFWGPSYGDESMKQFALQEQVLIGLDNIFKGYNPKRRWSLSLFLGGGVTRYMTTSQYALTTTGGLHVAYFVTPKLDVYLESGLQFAEPKAGAANTDCSWWKRHDRNLYVEVGVTYQLGKRGWKNAPDVEGINAMYQSEIDALNAQLNDALEENKRLKDGGAAASDAESVPNVEEIPDVEGEIKVHE